MPRGKSKRKEPVLRNLKTIGDLRFKFEKMMMFDGKYSKSRKCLDEVIKLTAQKASIKESEVVDKVVEKVKPTLEVKRAHRGGGSNFSVPMEIRSFRSISLAIKSLIKGGRNKKGKGIVDGLSEEFLDALNGKGFAMSKKEEKYKNAEANRVFVDS